MTWSTIGKWILALGIIATVVWFTRPYWQPAMDARLAYDQQQAAPAAQPAVQATPITIPGMDSGAKSAPDISSSGSVSSTEQVVEEVPAISNAQVVGLLQEVDQIHRLSRDGASYADFRYEVVSGTSATSSLWATESGVITNMRIACDDVCMNVVVISGNVVTDLTGMFSILVPEEANSAHYDKWTPFSEVTDWTSQLGANETDVLTQWVAMNVEIPLRIGDQILIISEDEESLQVNVGVFTSWTWE